jgi:hypothetical protein
MVTLNLSIQTKQISDESRVEFEVLDNTLGNLFSDNLDYEQLTRPLLQNHLKHLVSFHCSFVFQYSSLNELSLTSIDERLELILCFTITFSFCRENKMLVTHGSKYMNVCTFVFQYFSHIERLE